MLTFVLVKHSSPSQDEFAFFGDLDLSSAFMTKKTKQKNNTNNISISLSLYFVIVNINIVFTEYSEHGKHCLLNIIMLTLSLDGKQFSIHM